MYERREEAALFLEWKEKRVKTCKLLGFSGDKKEDVRDDE